MKIINMKINKRKINKMKIIKMKINKKYNQELIFIILKKKLVKNF